MTTRKTIRSGEHMVFVYGTLKRGHGNHSALEDQRYIGEAHTRPGHVLYHLGGFPGLKVDRMCQTVVGGEVWAVDAKTLARLDRIEGVASGLYARMKVKLGAPFSGAYVEAYFYARSVNGCEKISTWPPFEDGI